MNRTEGPERDHIYCHKDCRGLTLSINIARKKKTLLPHIIYPNQFQMENKATELLGENTACSFYDFSREKIFLKLFYSIS